MAWYYSLFDDVYKSAVGAKVLAAIENTALIGNLQGSFLCYLAVRKFERVATSLVAEDSDLFSAIASLEIALEAIGYPLTNDDSKMLRQIFKRNGFDWPGS